MATRGWSAGVNDMCNQTSRRWTGAQSLESQFDVVCVVRQGSNPQLPHDAVQFVPKRHDADALRQTNGRVVKPSSRAGPRPAWLDVPSDTSHQGGLGASM